jgi:hypothetical protein
MCLEFGRRAGRPALAIIEPPRATRMGASEACHAGQGTGESFWSCAVGRAKAERQPP